MHVSLTLLKMSGAIKPRLHLVSAGLFINRRFGFLFHHVPKSLVLEVDFHGVGPHGEIAAGEDGNLDHIFLFLPSEGR